LEYTFPAKPFSVRIYLFLSFVTQLLGIVIVGVFTFIISYVVWTILKSIMGIRVLEEDELKGLDNSELGMDSYPEFKQ